jgi:hypothetical protein
LTADTSSSRTNQPPSQEAPFAALREGFFIGLDPIFLKVYFDFVSLLLLKGITMENQMFAVFTEEAIVYVGDEVAEASDAMNERGGKKIVSVSSLEDLRDKFCAFLDSLNAECCDEGSESLNALLDRLADMDLAENAEEFAETVANAGSQAVGAVRSMGCKAAQTVGKGFIALGDLIREHADGEEFVEELQEQMQEDDKKD